ncbi:phage protease [Pseudomonas poae]|uniref:phage protease n=1 Tax=Pseudomonas poae TaxID=200451 RepID=UPI0030CEE14F
MGRTNPPGPNVTGRDGRQWLFDEQAGTLVQSSFLGRSIDLPIDWEHATQHRASKGESAPAAGWIKQLELRNGALWGLVDWTPRASEQVINREYRFLSPVFDFDPDTTRIARLVSAGLTNKPNFLLTALNQENTEVTPVTLSPALLAALGLPATATEEQALAAAAQLKATAQATNTEKPNLEQFMPRADYDSVLQRAANAEHALAEQKKTEHNKQVDALITTATQAGKITPATVDYHRAMCQDEAGLTRFKAFVDAAPVVADPANLGGRQPENNATALNSEEQAMCFQFGLDPAEFAKTKQSEV